MDPRIAQRRIEVRREEGRRRLRILLAALGVLAVIGAGLGVVHSPLLRVRHVEVRGAGDVPRATVLRAAGLAGERLMVDVDTTSMASGLDAVPALGDASVRRSWPATVDIRVAERTAVAQVARPGGRGVPVALLDATGRVVADASAAVAGLPVLIGLPAPPRPGGWLAGTAGPGAPVAAPHHAARGVPLSAPPGTPAGPGAALAVAAALPDVLRSHVATVTVTAGGSLSLGLTLPGRAPGAAPVAVSLGDGSRLAAKLTALATMVAQSPLSGVTGIDLTVPARPATRGGAAAHP